MVTWLSLATLKITWVHLPSCWITIPITSRWETKMIKTKIIYMEPRINNCSKMYQKSLTKKTLWRATKIKIISWNNLASVQAMKVLRKDLRGLWFKRTTSSLISLVKDNRWKKAFRWHDSSLTSLVLKNCCQWTLNSTNRRHRSSSGKITQIFWSMTESKKWEMDPLCHTNNSSKLMDHLTDSQIKWWRIILVIM